MLQASSTALLDLPAVLLVHALSSLEPRLLGRVACVCRELHALGAAAHLAMAGVLQPRIKQQSIDGFPLIVQLSSDGFHLLKIGQIRQQHPAVPIDPAEGLLGPLLTAADHSEAMPLLLETFGG